MKLTTDKILEKLRGLHIKYELEEHAAVFTVAESLEHLNGRMPVKNLLLQEEKGDKLIFVIMKGDERLDTKSLAAQCGTRKLQFAKPDVLMNTLGVEPGSASLFCLFLDSSKEVQVVIDPRLLDAPEVGFHPLNNTQTIFIHGRDVTKIIDTTGHVHQTMVILI